MPNAATGRLNPRPPSAVITVHSVGEFGITNALAWARELGQEIIDHRGVRMFGRNTVASTIAFALDLLILWALVELLLFPRVPAAVVAFAVPMVVFYVLSRVWVFPGSERGLATGFVYFLMNVGIGFAVMLAVFWTLLELTEIHYLIARLAASVASGVVIFLLNGVFNFKQL